MGTKVRFLFGLLLISSLCGLTTCGKRTGIQDGQVTGNTYSNGYFGFSVDFPAGWEVAPLEVQKELTNMGAEMVSGDDPASKAAVKASLKSTYDLLMVFKHPVGAPVPWNPSLILVAENLRGSPGIKTGKDYLYHMTRFLINSPMDYKIEQESAPLTLGGRKFYRSDLSVSITGQQTQQAYVSTVIQGYAISVILSWRSDEEKTVLEKALQTVKFK